MVTETNQNTLYVLVHIDSLGETPQREEVERIIKACPDRCYDGEPFLPPRYYVRHGQDRSSKDADFLPPPQDLVPGTEVKVCGAFNFPCVSDVHMKLKGRGYDVSIHEPGTLG